MIFVFRVPLIFLCLWGTMLILDDLTASTNSIGERGGVVVEPWTLDREVGGSRPTSAVLCP